MGHGYCPLLFKSFVAHHDWDGIVSMLYLAPWREAPIVTADYHDIPGIMPRLPAPALVTEVYLPEHLRPGDVVLDHHSPKFPGLEVLVGDGLTGHAVGAGGTLLFLSAERGRDLSNVRAVASLASRASYVHETASCLARHLQEPPEDVIRFSDVVDNPLAAETRDELLAALGHMYAASTGMLEELSRGTYRDVPAWMARIRSLGRTVLKEAEPLAERIAENGARGDKAVLILAPSRERKYLAAAAALLLQKLYGVRRIGYGYALPGGLVRVTLVSRDDWALRVAKALGGGGRRAHGGYVAGAVQRAETLEKMFQFQCLLDSSNQRKRPNSFLPLFSVFWIFRLHTHPVLVSSGFFASSMPTAKLCLF